MYTVSTIFIADDTRVKLPRALIKVVLSGERTQLDKTYTLNMLLTPIVQDHWQFTKILQHNKTEILLKVKNPVSTPKRSR